MHLFAVMNLPTRIQFSLDCTYLSMQGNMMGKPNNNTVLVEGQQAKGHVVLVMERKEKNLSGVGFNVSNKSEANSTTQYICPPALGPYPSWCCQKSKLTNLGMIKVSTLPAYRSTHKTLRTALPKIASTVLEHQSKRKRGRKCPEACKY